VKDWIKLDSDFWKLNRPGGMKAALMELRHVRYFLAVADERNFTRAAARLNVAQSPLSQQIRKLEREIGVQLFTRTTRSVALTRAGQVFYERMTQLLAAGADAVEAARKADRGELGTLSVGFTGSATYELLPPLMRAYADRYPDVLLDVQCDMDTPRQVEALLDGRLAVGVLRPPITADGLTVETLRHEPVVALLAGRHPASIQRELDLADLRDEWFISYNDEPPSVMYQVMKSACAAVGFVPRIRHVVADSSALVALVAADMGVALVPASLRHLGIRGATFRPLRSPRLSVPLALAYREPNVEPLVRRFVEVSRTVVRSLEGAQQPTPDPPGEDDGLYIDL
jgi:DNA-binding transcriptional LysR family regulator